MALPAKILAYGLLTWFGLLTLLIAIRILNRKITVTGFLTARPGGQALAPERVLQIAVFPAVVAFYVHAALNADMSVADGVRPSLPDVPQYLLILLTGSNSLYLAGKIARGA